MAVQNIIRFFQSNSLRFVRLEDYNLLQTDITRLYFDFDYTAIDNSIGCYFQKFVKTDRLWFQFRSDYSSGISAKIVAENQTEIDVSSNVVPITDFGDGRKQYEVNLDISGLTGLYYIELSFIEADKPIANFRTEWFDVQESFENTLLIEWNNDFEFPAYSDGIIWSSLTQKMYIESRISDYEPGSSKTVALDSAYSLETLKSQPLKSKLWQVELLPDYIIEKINLALNHSSFFVNKEQYNNEENGFEGLERQGDSRLYPFEMTLDLVKNIHGVKYEDYTTDYEITGEKPVLSNNNLLINDSGDNLLINDSGDKLKISGT